MGHRWGTRSLQARARCRADEGSRTSADRQANLEKRELWSRCVGVPLCRHCPAVPLDATEWHARRALDVTEWHREPAFSLNAMASGFAGPLFAVGLVYGTVAVAPAVRRDDRVHLVAEAAPGVVASWQQIDDLT